MRRKISITLFSFCVFFFFSVWFCFVASGAEKIVVDDHDGAIVAGDAAFIIVLMMALKLVVEVAIMVRLVKDCGNVIIASFLPGDKERKMIRKSR